MVNWRIMFLKPVLESGNNLFKNRRVQSLRKIGDTYTASVLDDEIHFVMADLRDGAVHVECDCSNGTRGVHCRHMAAALLAIEDRYLQNAPASRSSIRLFSPEECSAYYFDLSRITRNYSFSEDTYKKAKQMIQSGAMRLTQCRVVYDNKGEEFLSAYGVYGDLEGRSVFVCNENRPDSMHCTCKKDQGNEENKPCVHITALLLLLQQYIAAYDPGDGTPLQARELLAAFRPAKLEDSSRILMGEVIHLEPTLTMEYQGPALTFRIGSGKRYRLRNVSELVRACDTGGTLVFGKSLLDFSCSHFDEEGQWYYDLIHRAVSEAERNKENLKDKIFLTGRNLDDYFDRNKNRSVPLDDAYRGKTTAEMCEGNAPWELLLLPQMQGEQKLTGVSLTGNVPLLYTGDKYSYGWNTAERTLFRISREQKKMIDHLGSRYGTVNFFFGRKRLPEFYRRVLPEIEKVARVEQPDREKVMVLIPPAVEFTFYLDTKGKKILCTAEASYGEKKFLLSSVDEVREGFRDKEAENEIIELAQKFFPQKDETGFYCEKEEQVFRVLESGVNTLLRWGQVQATDSFLGLKIRRRVSLSVGLSVQSDLLELKIESDELSQRDIQSLLNSYRKKKKYHRLRNGDFVRVDEAVGEIGTVMDALHLTGEQIANARLPLYRAVYLNELLQEQDGLYIRRDERFAELIDRFEEGRSVKPELPAALKDVMRPYQAQGYQWLRTLDRCGFGGILADDMGLGKTLQMIAVLLACKEEGRSGVSLITAPASLVYNWFSELERFAPDLKACVITGTQARRKHILDSYESYDVLITSYDLLKRDVTLYENKHFAFHVLDEAQYIKNQGTTAARSVKVIVSRTRIALTGTPIENRISELWSIFDFLMPGYLYEYPLFREELEEPIVRFEDEDATLRLKRMIAPFILRRLKQDVLKELPEKLEEIRSAQPEGKQRKLYDALAAQLRSSLTQADDETFKRQKLELLAQLTRLRQICCDPALLYENYDGDSVKRTLCMDLIESAIEGEHRILLFSQFTSMLALLQKELDERKIAYFLLTGSTPNKERQRLVEAFNNGTVPVFLISLRAGGTGLNLTGADVVIHYDPWWNVAVQNQATDRAHRIGQEKIVSVYQLIAKDTIEEKIRLLQEKKHDLADALLSGETASLMNMTREDLLELL